MAERKYGLTTYDNPYDRNEDFQLWFLWDVNHGYNTLDLEVRKAHLSYLMTEDEENAAIDEAINEIIAEDVFNIYKRIDLKD